MPLLDVSLVTQALVELLKAHIGNSAAWPQAAGTPLVTAQPPDQLATGTLGVYLYHVAEDPSRKNQPPVGRDSPPVRFTPMGLQLYYQVSALGDGADGLANLQEQLLLGAAVKAFHDYPVIDDSVSVPRRAPQQPLDVLQSVGLDGAGNTLRIALQPVAYHEAQSFWNASSLAPRLAAYYEVSVVLLEPEKPTTLSGRVTSYGVQSFVGGAPRLDGSQNTVTVQVSGLAAQSLLARPAEVPVGGQAQLTGSDLFGDATDLLLQHFSWPDRKQADAAWGVVATTDRVSFTVQEVVDARPVVPGQYSARVRVTKRRTMPDRGTRDFGFVSNDTPLTISARIDTVTLAGDLGTISGYVFTNPDPTTSPFPTDAIQLCIGGVILTEVPPEPPAVPLEPGQFRVVDGATIDFRLPVDAVPGQPVSVRLFVLGAESPAQWVTP
jgi:hypothetical protein